MVSGGKSGPAATVPVSADEHAGFQVEQVVCAFGHAWVVEGAQLVYAHAEDRAPGMAGAFALVDEDARAVDELGVVDEGQVSFGNFAGSGVARVGSALEVGADGGPSAIQRFGFERGARAQFGDVDDGAGELVGSADTQSSASHNALESAVGRRSRAAGGDRGWGGQLARRQLQRSDGARSRGRGRRAVGPIGGSCRRADAAEAAPPVTASVAASA